MFRASKVLEPAFQEQPRSFFWQGLTENYQVDEAAYLKELIPLAQSDASEHKAITDTASSLIGKVRAQDGSVHMIDALLQEYSLDTQGTGTAEIRLAGEQSHSWAYGYFWRAAP